MINFAGIGKYSRKKGTLNTNIKLYFFCFIIALMTIEISLETRTLNIFMQC
jgi:hypothetical protein